MKLQPILRYGLFNSQYIQIRAFAALVEKEFDVELVDIQMKPGKVCVVEFEGQHRWFLQCASVFGTFELWRKDGEELVHEWGGLFGSKEDWGWCLSLVGNWE